MTNFTRRRFVQVSVGAVLSVVAGTAGMVDAYAESVAETSAVDAIHKGSILATLAQYVSESQLRGYTTMLETLDEERAGVLRFALDVVGLPYRYASKGPESFDCSGLTYAAWKSVGHELPGDSWGQKRYLEEVDVVLPGDIFWRPGHVGIAMGMDAHAVHASNQKYGVVFTETFNYKKILRVAGA